MWSTQSGVADARVLVVAEVEEGGPAVSVQIDAFVHHSFYDVYSKNTRPVKPPEPITRRSVPTDTTSIQLSIRGK